MFEVNGRIAAVLNLLLDRARVEVVMAAVELVQLLGEMFRAILHVAVEIVGLLRVDLEVDDKSLLLERPKPVDFDVEQN